MSTSPPAEYQLHAGQRFGAYLIDRALGKGGMGEVYEAEHLETGHRVALKILMGGSLHSLQERNRFLREGLLAAAINNPHSLYVYGTEEVDGRPLIAMELAPGGTLKDRVEASGPMDVPDAVDATLQLIDGLQAAEAAGVLHRDVKPSNCFVGADGTIKVGDYGLSISSLGSEATQLTATGSILGTPAFASPEQLRGDEIDVRSDIYSVGATLYYLLTGTTAFGDQSGLKLMASILEKAPTSPRLGRPEIPDALAKTVLRCLAKKPEDRLSSYDELRRRLSPFERQKRAPAELGRRVVAGAIDRFVGPLVGGIVFFGVDLDEVGGTVLWTNLALTFGASLAYFALAEGLAGAGLGKLLLNVRVVGPNNTAPGVPRSSLRALLFLLPELLIRILYVQLSLGLRRFHESTSVFWVDSLDVLAAFVFLLLFIPARRYNGFLALHDRWTRTRVVAARREEAIRPLVAGMAANDLSALGERAGPYRVGRPIEAIPPGSTVPGYDEKLRRRVWVHVVPPGSAALPDERRQLSRRGRFRWLHGRRQEGPGWDAYEAPPGKPLAAATLEESRWESVRFWLLDLAAEYDEASREGTLNFELSPDAVWITEDGRAMFLDFPWPDAVAESSGAPDPAAGVSGGSSPRDPAALQEFLYRVATRHDPARSEPLPLHATRLLASLKAGAFDSLEDLEQELRAAAIPPAGVERSLRARHLAVSGIPALAMIVLMGASVLLTFSYIDKYPEAAKLDECLDEIEDLQKASSPDPENAGRIEAIETYIAGRLRNAVPDSTESFLGMIPAKELILGEDGEQRTREVLEARGDPTEEEIAAAVASLGEFGERLEGESLPNVLSEKWGVAVSFVLAVALSVAGTLGLLSGLFFRGGVVLRAMGVAIVTRDGKEVSRVRAALRTIVAWSPVWLFWILSMSGVRGEVGSGGIVLSMDESDGSIATVMLFLFPVFTAGLIAAIARPARGWQDKITGTFLVPR